jgi:hypothetical protein
LIKTPDLAVDMKRRRLQFMWHVARMDDARVVTNILESRPNGRRNVRRESEC